VARPQRGLGRGLDALLGEKPLPVSPRESDGLREIPVDVIVPNPFQPRKDFDQDALDELKRSIEQFGVLVPIIVRRRGERFQIIAGERRWRACAALQRATIPAIVRETGDRDSLEVAIVENLQREDLNPLEEAAGYAQLVEDYSLTQEQVAARVGKSRPAIANALRLLALPDSIRAMIVEKRLSAGHARALLAAPEALRLALAQRAVAADLSVHALERIAQKSERPQPSNGVERADLGSSEDYDFEKRLRERYGTRIRLVRTARGGRIEFHFSDERELIDLGDRLLGSAEP
jgi:ParB family chromosome partitioning protein